MKRTNPRKCRVCKDPFHPLSMSHVVCWKKECVTEFIRQTEAKADARRQKADRKETAERKVAMRSRYDWIRRAQAAFNAFIRERDKDKPCICCGQPLTLEAIGGGYDCGHYRSTGSAPHLRFNELNAHAQRKVCNRHGAGRAVDYRIGLVKRIGAAAVEALEADNGTVKWSIDDLRLIEATYKAKLKHLSAERGASCLSKEQCAPQARGEPT